MDSVHIDWVQSLFCSKIRGEERKKLNEHDILGASGKATCGLKIMLAQLFCLFVLLRSFPWIFEQKRNCSQVRNNLPLLLTYV